MSAPMREDWNERARENAYYWVLASRREWEKNAYYKEGERDVNQYVLPFFERKRITQDQHAKFSVLDIGSGTGRLCRALAQHTNHVIGIDVSTEMIEISKQDNSNYTNIEFLPGFGRDLAPLSDNTIDFCFSFVVFQHIPSKTIIRSYFQEILRVLKPGGRAKIQVRGTPGNIPGSVLWSQGFDRFYFALILWKRCLLLPWIRLYNSLFGAFYSEAELQKLISDLGFGEVETERETAKYLWVSMRKPLE